MQKYSMFFYVAIAAWLVAFVCVLAFFGLVPWALITPGQRWVALVVAGGFGAVGWFVLWPKRFRKTPESREGGPYIP